MRSMQGALSSTAQRAAPETDPSTPDGSADHEGAESPQFEQQEQAGGMDDDEQTESQPDAEGAADAGEDEGAQAAQAGAKPTPANRNLFNLATGRVMQALAQAGQALDTALKADPVQATVKFGTAAVHTVAQSAQAAGRPIPFDILIQVGMQTIKELGAIANEKGYLPDQQIGVFLKEAFQQSLAQYAQMDVQAGELDPRMLRQFVAQAGGQSGAPAGPGALSSMQNNGG